MSWTPWAVKWDEHASRDLEALARRDQRLARRIRQAVTTYSTTGHGDVRKLRGYLNWWRQRVGTWRVIFTLDPQTRTLPVLSVAPRSEAYRSR